MGFEFPPPPCTKRIARAAVWIVKLDHTIELRPIEVARYDTDSVEIGSGLRAGERIVTAGVHKLLAGQEVRLLPDSSK